MSAVLLKTGILQIQKWDNYVQNKTTIRYCVLKGKVK